VPINQHTPVNNRHYGIRCERTSLKRFEVGLFLAALICFSCVPTFAGRKRQLQTAGVDFGNVTVGTTSTQTVVITNIGNASANISGATVSGGGFNYVGPALPLTLSSGQSVNLTVTFAPSAAGAATGTLSLSTNANVTPNTIPLTGTGVLPPQATPTLSLTVSPLSISFGSIPVGTSSTQTVSLVNPGTGTVSISQAPVTGSSFGMSGLALPLTLGPGQSGAFTVSFHPAGTGSASGSISVMSNASNAVSTVALSGTGVQPAISVVPGSVNFGTVTVGQTSSQTVTLSNPGSANLNITQVAGPSTGFGLNGLALPLTVAPGKSATFMVSFTPTSGASSSSSLTLVSNAPTSPTTIPLSGGGLAPVLQLTPSTTSLSFGSETLNASATQSVTLTNTGNSAVSISQVSVAGTGFSLNGSAPLVTLSAGQSASFGVAFTPTVAGSATGTASVVSTAANSPLSISLSGSGAQPHFVSLAWSESSSGVVGYYVYSSTQASGPPAKLNSTPVSTAAYTDNTVQSGQTYYYWVTAVNSSGVESTYSNNVAATIP
jgi:ASPM-SPD-2-Hydin domain-containing protein/centrosomal CEP192-like protein